MCGVISLKIKHFNEDKRRIDQDCREVNTKFSKAIVTQVFPVKEDIQQIVIEWVEYLKNDLLFGVDDPLFPSVKNEFDHDEQVFKCENLSKRHIASTTTLRSIVKQASENANMTYFNPHTYRDTLSHMGQRLCKSPEEYKAWSQNLGHQNLLTTFTSYGYVNEHRQCDIIKEIKNEKKQGSS